MFSLTLIEMSSSEILALPVLWAARVSSLKLMSALPTTWAQNRLANNITMRNPTFGQLVAFYMSLQRYMLLSKQQLISSWHRRLKKEKLTGFPLSTLMIFTESFINAWAKNNIIDHLLKIYWICLKSSMLSNQENSGSRILIQGQKKRKYFVNVKEHLKKKKLK